MTFNDIWHHWPVQDLSSLALWVMAVMFNYNCHLVSWAVTWRLMTVIQAWETANRSDSLVKGTRSRVWSQATLSLYSTKRSTMFSVVTATTFRWPWKLRWPSHCAVSSARFRRSTIGHSSSVVYQVRDVIYYSMFKGRFYVFKVDLKFYWLFWGSVDEDSSLKVV